MPRRKWLPLALAVYTACLAAAWWSERRARIAAEAELARERSRVQHSRTEKRAPAAAPAATGPAPAAIVPAAAPDPSPAHAENAPPPTRPDLRASEPSPAPAGDTGDPQEVFDRLLAQWRDRPHAAQGRLDRETERAIIQALQRLIQSSGPRLAESMARAARELPPDDLMASFLISLLAGVDRERAAQIARDRLDTATPQNYSRVVNFLGYLPREEADTYWRRALADADPGVRLLAATHPPRDGPEYDEPLRQVALHEADPEQRGSALATLFERTPTPDNLNLIAHEIQHDRDPKFQAAVLEGISGNLTIRDTEMIRIVSGIARDAGADKEVRLEAIDVLIGHGDRLVSPAEEAQWDELESKLRDQE